MTKQPHIQDPPSSTMKCLVREEKSNLPAGFSESFSQVNYLPDDEGPPRGTSYLTHVFHTTISDLIFDRCEERCYDHRAINFTGFFFSGNWILELFGGALEMLLLGWGSFFRVSSGGNHASSRGGNVFWKLRGQTPKHHLCPSVTAHTV